MTATRPPRTAPPITRPVPVGGAGSGRATGRPRSQRPLHHGASGPPPWHPQARRRHWRAGDSRRRAVVLLLLLSLAFVAVGARLTQLQVVDPERYAAAGEAQRLRSITLPADRGAIFDRHGNELAMSLEQQTVWVDPRQVTDPAGAAAALAPVLGMDVADVRNRLTRSGAFAYLARQVDDGTAEAVRALALPGVGLMPEPKRFLPAGDLAASTLGGVGVDGNGLSGLELQYDDLLTGEPGELVVERGLDGSTIAVGEHRLVPAARGDDLVLTIDRSIQYALEDSLSRAITSSRAEGGMAVVSDPRTGEILALASLEAEEGQPPRPAGRNAVFTDVFEPGSVNKVITLSGAIEDGLYEPDSRLTVPDTLQVSVHAYTDDHGHAPADWTVADIMANSSNVGTIMIAQELGKERIDHYLREFGFGSRTGAGVPGESAGILLDPEDWVGTSIGSVPIGNGLAVTAIQMLSAYNVVANGGEYVAPSLVKGVVDAEGVERPVGPATRRRVLSPETAEGMRAMLAEVVESGTGTNAAIDGYTVAGKTGTARKPSTTRRGYEPGAYMSSFAGFVPAEDPQLSVIVVLDEPTPIYGGIVAAPVFAEVASYGLRQLRIPPAADTGRLEAPLTEPPDATLAPDADVTLPSP